VVEDVTTLDPESLQPFSDLPEPRARAFSETVVHSSGAMGKCAEFAQGFDRGGPQMSGPVAARQIPFIAIEKPPTNVVGQAGVLRSAQP
jgi:hypothetical protein